VLVEQPHAHERHAEVAGGLEVVAREDAEAAIAAEQANLERTKAEKIAEGEAEAAGIEEAARDKIKEVNDFLTNEFERAINASS
jgi:hypothetical protein